MNSSLYLRCALLGMLVSTPPVFSLTGNADSARGNLDTVAPQTGRVHIPRVAEVSGVEIKYSGASDFSGIDHVELWFREDSGSWTEYGKTDTGEDGSFFFVPGDEGLFHFDFVAEDKVGNRSTVPDGSQGSGQGTTSFTDFAGQNIWMMF